MHGFCLKCYLTVRMILVHACLLYRFVKWDMLHGLNECAWKHPCPPQFSSFHIWQTSGFSHELLFKQSAVLSSGPQDSSAISTQLQFKPCKSSTAGLKQVAGSPWLACWEVPVASAAPTRDAGHPSRAGGRVKQGPTVPPAVCQRSVGSRWAPGGPCGPAWVPISIVH